jgi:CheY-like chemotaxis protein
LVLRPATPDQSLTIAEVGSALQILTNLLLNAIAFTPAGGTVTLEVGPLGAQVLFAVTDEGPGISPDRARSLFAGPVSTRRGGAGVGLRHSHALAAAHGGKLSVIPSNEHGGGCFELTWPISEARSSTRPQPPLPLPSVRGSRVLVVEDDAAVRSLIELSLEARGAETTLVGEANALERVLQNGRFDVALVDLSPIAAHCTEFFTRLRATNPDIAVILISGVASGVPHEIESQVSAWVRKPFEMGEVLDTMARLLSTQKLADEPETAVG